MDCFVASLLAMTTAMNRYLSLLSLMVGGVSALAFEPVGLWPLMPLAFAALCWLIDGAPSLKRA